MGIGAGKGKTILFGEHFVVYGYPAIAAGIGAETIAKISIKDTPGWSLSDRRPEMPGYKKEKTEEQRVSIENIIKFCGLDLSEKGIHIEFEGDLVCASGIGASAASCVALARALNDEFNLGFDDEKINEAAYEGEKGYHGTPSGIDNTASTFGGLVWYVRDLEGGPPLFEKIKLSTPVDLVIAATGLTASTKTVVAAVRAKRKENPGWFETLANKYDQLVKNAREALVSLNLQNVGELMNQNHELLQELTVSCKELDKLVVAARENGALGAKLTGTGRGGNMIALASNSQTAQEIATALKDAGAAAVWITSFGL